MNKILKGTLKKKLQACKGKWPEELPRVLWAYWTTERTSTGHTPYSMVYGCEAVIPIETTILSHRRDTYDPAQNHALLQESLDLIEEIREESQVQLKMYQGKIARHFNSRVKSFKFETGDLVLRRVFPATQDPGVGVLGPNWEGSYEIQQEICPGTYRLKRLDGSEVPRAWNAEHLRKYYQ